MYTNREANLCKIIEEGKTQDPRKFRKLFCGEELNRGCTRVVYTFLPDSRYVVKIAKQSPFTNVLEWEIYNEADWENKKIKEFLAPCLLISDNGKILIQRRVRHKKRITSYPEKVPHFFTDCKTTNYGWIGKRFVCCDYGNFSLIRGMRTIDKKADWWQITPNKYKMKSN